MKKLLLAVLVLGVVAGAAIANPDFIAVANNVQGQGYIIRASDGSQVNLENGVKLYNQDQIRLKVGTSVQLVSVGYGVKPVTLISTGGIMGIFDAETGELIPTVPGAPAPDWIRGRLTAYSDYS
jgi:hypothetical protein